ncbi:uncharacterized protein LOC135695589 isoform X2 [Rhopilema esculentum]|uniref:uncharacterized protein LOC135695589 isoform X2 n=1 Tax=Rhopilema esculentum TaxID=499914 RepID=UPI0031DAE0DD
MKCYHLILLSMQIGFVQISFASTSYSLFYLNGESNESRAIICPVCMPGYEAAWQCVQMSQTDLNSSWNKAALNLFKTYHHCTPCLWGTFSTGQSINQTCKRCSYCPPQHVVLQRCTSVSDTKCAFRGHYQPFTEYTGLLVKEVTPFAVVTSASAMTYTPERKVLGNDRISMTISSIVLFFSVILVVCFIPLILKMRRKFGTSKNANVAMEGIVTVTNISPRQEEEVSYDIIGDGTQRTTSTIISWECSDTFTTGRDPSIKVNLGTPEPEDEKLNVRNIFGSKNSLTDESLVIHQTFHFNPSCQDFPSQRHLSYLLSNEESSINDAIGPNDLDIDDPFDGPSIGLNIDRNEVDDNPIEAALLFDPESTSEAFSDMDISGLSTRIGSSIDSESYDEPRITLQRSKFFESTGGYLDIEGTSVSIRVPKGAIPEGQIKMINVSVHICRPNDWKDLQKSGCTTDLPLVELGPKGSRFLKPIEVIIRRPPGDELENATFEFTEEDVLSQDAVWVSATKCISRRQAKSTAKTCKPSVSFCFQKEKLHAFYLHFTGGRIMRKKPKCKWMNASAFFKTHGLLGNCLGLKIVFWEQTPEGETLMKKEAEEFTEAALSRKALKVQNADNSYVEIIVKKPNEDWPLEFGDLKQDCSFDSVFDPECIGNLPVADFTFHRRSEDLVSFRCLVDIVQKGKKEIDLKVIISQEYLEEKYRSSRFGSTSSGFCSMTSHQAVHVIYDQSFKNVEPREYLRRTFLKLSEHIAGCYENFASHNSQLTPLRSCAEAI